MAYEDNTSTHQTDDGDDKEVHKPLTSPERSVVSQVINTDPMEYKTILSTASHSRASNIRSIDRVEKLRKVESQLGITGTPGTAHRGAITPLTSLDNVPIKTNRRASKGQVYITIPQTETSVLYDAPYRSTTAVAGSTHVKKIDDPVHRYGEGYTDQHVNFIDLEGQLAAKTDELEFRRKTFWKSCCGVVDRRAVQYIVQVTMGFFVMGFCMYRIIDAPTRRCDSEDNTTVFVAMISSLIGWFLPSPKFN